jgi:hypothetical protein
MHNFVVMADPVVMNPVTPMRCWVPMLCRVVRVPHECPARAVPKHLPVTQPAAPAVSPARGTRDVVMSVPGFAMGAVRAAMSMSRSTTVHVDPAVRRARSRHGRKRRWRLGRNLLLRRRSRRNFGCSLLRGRQRLVGRSLLRS